VLYACRERRAQPLPQRVFLAPRSRTIPAATAVARSLFGLGQRGEMLFGRFHHGKLVRCLAAPHAARFDEGRIDTAAISSSRRHISASSREVNFRASLIDIRLRSRSWPTIDRGFEAQPRAVDQPILQKLTSSIRVWRIMRGTRQGRSNCAGVARRQFHCQRPEGPCEAIAVVRVGLDGRERTGVSDLVLEAVRQEISLVRIHLPPPGSPRVLA
jgi:hypothetical protein